MGALLSCHHTSNKHKDVAFYIERVKYYYLHCFHPNAECDLLTGIAGYLYCLLNIRVNVRKQDVKGTGLDDLNELVVSLVERLYDLGF